MKQLGTRGVIGIPYTLDLLFCSCGLDLDACIHQSDSVWYSTKQGHGLYFLVIYKVSTSVGIASARLSLNRMGRVWMAWKKKEKIACPRFDHGTFGIWARRSSFWANMLLLENVEGIPKGRLMNETRSELHLPGALFRWVWYIHYTILGLANIRFRLSSKILTWGS